MQRRSANTTKVFVGSLPIGTTSDELRKLFEPYGEIAECDVVNRCGFLHMEDKDLAFKAIQDLNNTFFNGNRISVEKGRVKTLQNERRDGRFGPGGPGGPIGLGRGAARNGFGPMRGGRDNFRSAPYMREGGGDFERRGPPPRPMGMGYERGFDNRPPPPQGMMSSGPPMRNNYTTGPGNRSYMTEQPGHFPDEGRYPEGGYETGTERMFPENHSMYPDERKPMLEDRPPIDQRGQFEHRPDRPYGAPIMADRRPLLDQSGPPMGSAGNGPGMHAQMPPMQPYDRRPAPDMYSRREPPKPVGGYNDPVHNPGYETAYPPIQPRDYTGAPGPRRDMPLVRRF